MTRRRGVAGALLAGAALAFGLWVAGRDGPPGSGLQSPLIAPVYSNPQTAELGIAGRQGIILEKGEFFTVNYNPAWGSAFWVAECLTPADLKGKASRKGVAFYADPGLPDSLAVTPKDYAGTGLDRGHLTPAGDMVRSKAAMKASFSMANMHAQTPNLNRQSWRLLEEAVRESVKVKSRAWIVTGQLVGEFPRYIGKTHRVAVPDFSFKAVCMLDRLGNYSGFGALGENIKKGATVSYVPIDSIEALSGFDFFPLLPDSIEDKIGRAR